MQALQEAYGKCAVFSTVYIKEAHAADEYPLGSHVVVSQHRSLVDRATAARRFTAATGWQLPLLMDGMEDLFTTALAAYPERFFVLEPNAARRSRLLFCSPGRCGGVRLEDLEAFLRERLGTLP